MVQNLLLWAHPTMHPFCAVASLGSSRLEEPLFWVMESSRMTHKKCLLLFPRPY
ncbi:hypothetical protein ACJRO7_020949 [Eucalyptus globulus]|uniref:Uncharacterized protein n=1 Tax=Eucalyptus globulus TaxID=34317 RepID=A0ABD3KR12_EUCGL